MRYPALGMVLGLLSACGPARHFIRGGHAGVEAQLVVLAADALTGDEQASRGPLCDPTLTTCPDKAPKP